MFPFYGWTLVPYIEIKATTPPTLANINAFDGQNNAPIYVPHNSVNAYKTATNWVNLASRIFSINGPVSGGDNSYEPDGVTIVLNEDNELSVSKNLEIDGGTFI